MKTSVCCMVGLIALLLASGISRGEVTPQTASCDDNTQCAEQADVARRLSKEGRLEEALHAYAAAYQLQADPKLLFNIARVAHKLGRPAEAAVYYQRYLDAGEEIIAEQRIKAQGYLTQARAEALDKSQAAKPGADSTKPNRESVQAETRSTVTARMPREHSTARRPTWRLVTGSILLGSGLLLIGFGGSALAANDTCQDGTRSTICDPYRNTTRVGSGLMGTGALSTLASIVLLALPGK